MNQSYLASAVLLIGAILGAFNIKIDNNLINAIVAGVLSLWVVIDQLRQGNTTIVGTSK